MGAALTLLPREAVRMDPQLLTYYEAIERASADMLAAARAGDWNQVVKLEGACVLLISQLRLASEPANTPVPAAAVSGPSSAGAARAKSRLMQRILMNDAEIRQLAEPWLADLDDTLTGRPRTLH
jgi:flagellar protein FliT